MAISWWEATNCVQFTSHQMISHRQVLTVSQFSFSGQSKDQRSACAGLLWSQKMENVSERRSPYNFSLLGPAHSSFLFVLLRNSGPRKKKLRRAPFLFLFLFPLFPDNLLFLFIFVDPGIGKKRKRKSLSAITMKLWPLRGWRSGSHSSGQCWSCDQEPALAPREWLIGSTLRWKRPWAYAKARYFRSHFLLFLISWPGLHEMYRYAAETSGPGQRNGNLESDWTLINLFIKDAATHKR